MCVDCRPYRPILLRVNLSASRKKSVCGGGAGGSGACAVGVGLGVCAPHHMCKCVCVSHVCACALWLCACGRPRREEKAESTSNAWHRHGVTQIRQELLRRTDDPPALHSRVYLHRSRDSGTRVSPRNAFPLAAGAALPLPRLVLEERVQAVLVSHEVGTASSAGVSAGNAGL